MNTAVAVILITLPCVNADVCCITKQTPLSSSIKSRGSYGWEGRCEPDTLLSPHQSSGESPLGTACHLAQEYHH